MKKWLKICLFLGICYLFIACGMEPEEQETGYQVWYINQKETKLDYECKELYGNDTNMLFKELLTLLRSSPEDEKYKPVLPENIHIEKYELENNQLYLDFSAEYLNMSKPYEVLCRAAIVRTLCQLPEVDYVGFRVNGQPLLDLNGKAIGLMNQEHFIENAGEEINAYKTADLKLYYTNATGDKLLVQRVAMEYNSNISLEKLIVERLIAGPPFEGVYASIPSSTQLLSIVIKDDICYVNLDEGFLKSANNVTEEIPVYSIVNSLIENTSVKKVQISINGETNRVFRESISFDTIFEKNEELIE